MFDGGHAEFEMFTGYRGEVCCQPLDIQVWGIQSALGNLGLRTGVLAKKTHFGAIYTGAPVKVMGLDTIAEVASVGMEGG